METATPDDEASDGEETTYCYWDEETQMYYYWDDALQAYVGWVEEAEGDFEEAAPHAASGGAGPSAAESSSGLAEGAMKEDARPSRGRDWTAEVVGKKESDEDLEQILVDEAQRGGNRDVVRKLTRKLTVVGKEKSMAEKLAALATAREKVGAGDELTDERIMERHRTEMVMENARATARATGGSSSRGSYSDTANSDPASGGGVEALAADGVPPAAVAGLVGRRSSAPVLDGGESSRAAAVGRRGTARFGTSHFKDMQTGDRLMEMLGRKLK